MRCRLLLAARPCASITRTAGTADASVSCRGAADKNSSRLRSKDRSDGSCPLHRLINERELVAISLYNTERQSRASEFATSRRVIDLPKYLERGTDREEEEEAEERSQQGSADFRDARQTLRGWLATNRGISVS